MARPPRKRPTGGDSTTRDRRTDLYREHPAEYAPRESPTLLDVPPARYLAVSGRGAPGGPEFQAAVSSLYPVAFTIKFRSKSRGKDFRVMGLEGQWDVPEDTWGPSHAGLAGMPWKLLIRVPEFVTARDVRGATLELKGRGKPLAASVRLETIREGRCVQALHVGPYAEETRTVARLVEAARRDGYSLTGPHHELYLSDPRRVPADRLRTILRYPVRR